MPKVVDHEERRAELCAAVWRLASREGLEAVTVRRVAEEAGWSTGAVVHYFSDKEDLLLSAFQTVADRVSRRLEKLEERTNEPLELARAWLVEGLPLDGERKGRGARLVCPARTGADASRAGPRPATDVPGMARPGGGALREAQDAGVVRADVDCAAAATALVALVDGLAIQATFEPRAVSGGRAVELVDAHLDALRA